MKWTAEQYRAEIERYKSTHFSGPKVINRDGHHILLRSGCRDSIKIFCETCNTFQLAFEPSEVETLIDRHIMEEK